MRMENFVVPFLVVVTLNNYFLYKEKFIFELYTKFCFVCMKLWRKKVKCTLNETSTWNKLQDYRASPPKPDNLRSVTITDNFKTKTCKSQTILIPEDTPSFNIKLFSNYTNDDPHTKLFNHASTGTNAKIEIIICTFVWH